MVLGNKRDLPNALDENGLIERMYTRFNFSIMANRVGVVTHPPLLFIFYYFFSLGTCLPFRTERYVAIRFHAKRKAILTLPYSGSLHIPRAVEAVKNVYSSENTTSDDNNDNNNNLKVIQDLGSDI